MASYYNDFTNAFVAVPEVSEALSKTPLEVFDRIFASYIQLALKLANLSPQQSSDIEIIHQRFKKQIVSGGELEKNAVVYLQLLGDHKSKLIDFISKLKEPNIHYHEVLTELVESMLKAHKLKMQGKEFKDADSESDNVVWTQTQITYPLAIIHVVIAHFFERYTYRCFHHIDADVILPKDFFLNALDDVIILEEIGDPGKSDIFNIWNREKETGGLSWLSEEKVAAYRTYYHKT